MILLINSIDFQNRGALLGIAWFKENPFTDRRQAPRGCWMRWPHSLFVCHSKCKKKSEFQHTDQISGIGASWTGALSTALDYKSGRLSEFR